MSIAVPLRFEYKVALDVRLQQPINGTNLGEPRLMLDNATHNYATRGRRTVYDDGPASSTPASSLGAYTTTIATAGVAELLTQIWVPLSKDTAELTYTAWVDDTELIITVHDDVAKSTLLDGSIQVSASAGVELTDILDVSARTTDFVMLSISYKAGDATPANSKLYNITVFESDLVDGDLPT